MRKTFVLDTNVLLHSDQAIFCFEDNIVILPETVIDELDNKKTERGEIGYNARATARILDRLRVKGNLLEGVRLETGGILKLALKSEEADRHKKNDDKIIATCIEIMATHENVFLVSKDALMRIKATILGVKTEDFKNDQVSGLDEQYKGRIKLYTTQSTLDEIIEQFKKQARFFIGNDVEFFDQQHETFKHNEFVQNEFVTLKGYESNTSVLSYYQNGYLYKLKTSFGNANPYGIKPRNEGQRLAIEALSRDDVPLVILKGQAGTAKTFLGLGVGLEKVLIEKNESSFSKILVCRPNIKMDEEIGYLPGDEKQKIAPLMRPIVDNLRILVKIGEGFKAKKDSDWTRRLAKLFDEVIDMESVGFLRGRSISNHWIIIDEAQNLTPGQVKGIITRVGIGSKIVLLGDPDQIDHPYLDSRSNGISYASEKMKGSNLCFQVTFNDNECVRSELAAEGANRL